jgi:hypothetical protein
MWGLTVEGKYQLAGLADRNLVRMTFLHGTTEELRMECVLFAGLLRRRNDTLSRKT